MLWLALISTGELGVQVARSTWFVSCNRTANGNRILAFLWSQKFVNKDIQHQSETECHNIEAASILTREGSIGNLFSENLCVATLWYLRQVLTFSWENLWRIRQTSVCTAVPPGLHLPIVLPMDSLESSSPNAVGTGQSEDGCASTHPNEPTNKRKSDENDVSEKRRKKRRRGRGGKKLPPGERYVPPPQKRNPGISFGPEHFQETSYYFEGGLRKVRPYYFDFKTYCKGRWVGKTLLEVFSSEFRAETIEYYEEAARIGRIRLNEQPIKDLRITLKHNDFMKNTVHRHEPPVCAQPLEILAQDDDLVIVNKPASLPVHPCGRFRHNTVIFILGKEHGISGLHTVHRLDRLTSGVLLFARTLEASQKLDQLVRDRQLEKEYVCRVRGVFPEEEVICEEPILVVSYKVGVCRVDPKGKPCRTVFQRLSTNGRSSVVRCLPLTGRTHQIRVHLQFLGHPILNDPIYCSEAWGPEGGKGGQVNLSNEELLRALIVEHRAKESLHLLDLTEGDLDEKGEPQRNDCPTETGITDKGSVPHLTLDTSYNTGSQGEKLGANCKIADCSVSSEEPASLNDMQNGAGNEQFFETSLNTKCFNLPSEPEKVDTDSSVDRVQNTVTKDPLCSECKIVRKDPTEKELIMYLHALCYKGPDFKYSTELPAWAREDWHDE
ncbi:RNA pseudouridylate synthase domain-containing protein 2 [Erpetoichthys calabaricus]|uniref:RNA pseudouridylate synthase domain-containing protein 2 n=1 Tax=Erpetoichthys calabaricus TaxID=27687 RepID=UPI002234DAEC|nr:RNA pseudouridylate synthase domain-containing protein 2 [Erpetoichthys calabaricus]